MPKQGAGGYYAVARGRKVGIFTTWTECEQNVKGFTNAKFKKFNTENEANDFVIQNREVATENKVAADKYTIGSHFKYEPPDGADIKRSVGTILLDSPLRVSCSKRVRTDSPKKAEIPKNIDGKTFLPFVVDNDDYVNVWVDGACLDNGKERPRAGIGIWWGDDHPLNLSAPVDGPPTNNTAEIQAARTAIEIAIKADFKKLRINTDSNFVIQCMMQWMKNWKKNGWKLANGGDVKNRIELEKLDKAQENIIVEWEKVPAHSGVHGNEMADRLARDGASRY